jgi:glycosyltransferase involved in cell wall biosynthesis
VTAIPDVCFVLEGTYPYVSGGVSSWLHSLIQGLPDLRFTIMFIGSTRAARSDLKYTLPPNVVGVEEFYIFDKTEDPNISRSHARSLESGLCETFSNLHHELKCGHGIAELSQLADVFKLKNKNAPSVDRLLRSRESWQILLDLYQQYSPDSAFLDYYWTFIYTHQPIFRLLSANIPDAKVYHTLSTGYAGFLAALAKQRTGNPMMITEHGIYTRERELEIDQADWIESEEHDGLAMSPSKSSLKKWWIDMFRFFSYATYASTDHVISITAVNQFYQRRDGADPDQMKVIPNGINIERFAAIRKKEPRISGSVFNVGFVGRVVPIKDIKTWLRAMRVCLEQVPELRGLLVGPYDEDQEYYEECLELSHNLGLGGVVEFVGLANVFDYYPLMDVVVLTSISEAVPLVILEANCAGIPVVATNVGAVADMLVGQDDADRSLGPSGIITPVLSPEATGRALVRLARDPALYSAMARAGIERVERFYRLEKVCEAYKKLYTEMIN